LQDFGLKCANLFQLQQRARGMQNVVIERTCGLTTSAEDGLCYRNGSYEDDIDYSADPDPPLNASDARWAAALVRKRGFRGGSL
jgi:hypothetical protein